MTIIEFMKPLGKFLKFSKEIDESIKKIHPKKIDSNYLSFVSGKITYKNLSKQIEAGCFNPNWDMLKRRRSNLRPIIFLLSIGGLGKNPARYVKYASILEMIHNGTLIHDDIEDCAKVRRDDKPIYLKYGLDVAVNSANILYFAPFLFFRKYPKDFSEKTKLKAYDCLLEHLNRVTWGQAIDIYWHNKSNVPSLKDYLQMCCYKTGAIDRMVFSFAGILSGKNQKTIFNLEKFGEKLGICFQIHDDFLDVCSINRKAIGNKTLGNDISEGKKSLVNILALQKLDKPESKVLLKILSEQTNKKNKILRALKLIIESGALEQTLKIARKEFNHLKKDCLSIFDKKHGKIMYEFLEAMNKDMEIKHSELIKWEK